jgi:hypothetical protein
MNRVQQYEKVCNLVRKEFMSIYYHEYDEDDCYWIGEDIGGICSIGDEYWNINNMVDALRYKVSEKLLFKWYYDVHVNEQAEVNYNLKSYISFKK